MGTATFNALREPGTIGENRGPPPAETGLSCSNWAHEYRASGTARRRNGIWSRLQVNVLAVVGYQPDRARLG